MSSQNLIFVNRFFFPDHSATSQMLSDLAFDLASDLQSVKVICSRRSYDDSSINLSSFEKLNGVEVIRVWTSRNGNTNNVGRLIDYATFYVTAAWMLLKHTTSETIVIVKTDPPLFSIVASVIVKFRGAKIVNWLQDLFPEVALSLGLRMMRWPIYPILKSLRNRSLKAADLNIVIGKLMQQKLFTEGVPSWKIRIIHNWADGEKLKPTMSRKNCLRERWGLNNKFIVGYSGNLGRAHEFETIFDSAEKLKNRNDIVFLFIGGGAQKERLQQQAVNKNLENVIFKPYQNREDLNQSLGVSDVHLASLNPALERLIVPSKFYGIAAVGRPTVFIGDPKGEISTVIEKFECGYSISPGHSHELVEKILFLADNPKTTENLGLNARRAFDQYFDRLVAIEKFRNAITHIDI